VYPSNAVLAVGEHILGVLSALALDHRGRDTVQHHQTVAAVFHHIAGVAAARYERRKLERLCRYITRPAIAEPRLLLTPSGNVRYQLKTPYRDGTTHVIFEPLDFMARLAALVPRPRVTNSPGANLNCRRLAPKGRGQEARVI
jgi:hypothetical protein